MAGGYTGSHIIGNISKIFMYFKRYILSLNNRVHATAEHGEQSSVNNGENSVIKDKGVELLRELYKVNPYLARLLEVYPDYFLKWDTEALGLFMWRVWESLIGLNDEGRRKLEEEINNLINNKKAPRKLRNAAKIARKLIENEKRILNITY